MIVVPLGKLLDAPDTTTGTDVSTVAPLLGELINRVGCCGGVGTPVKLRPTTFEVATVAPLLMMKATRLPVAVSSASGTVLLTFSDHEPSALGTTPASPKVLPLALRIRTKTVAPKGRLVVVPLTGTTPLMAKVAPFAGLAIVMVAPLGGAVVGVAVGGGAVVGVAVGVLVGGGGGAATPNVT